MAFFSVWFVSVCDGLKGKLSIAKQNCKGNFDLLIDAKHNAAVIRMRAAYGVNNDADLARALGVTRASIAHWHRAEVSLEKAKQCAEETGKTLDWIYFGREQVMEATGNYQVKDPLFSKIKLLTDTQRIAISTIIDEFLKDNERSQAAREFVDRLKGINGK